MSGKHSIGRMVFVSLFIVGLMAAAAPACQDADDRSAQWKKVEESRNRGLPKTAIEHLTAIIPNALSEKKYAEAVKAIAQKAALEGMILGDQTEEKIFRLQAAMANLPPETRPALEAILAHWYWQYYRQNRRRFSLRTETAATPSDDIQTWALPQILAEVDKHFTAAFKNPEQLKGIPVKQWDDLIVKGTMGDQFRPTLYDFLVHEAVDFYQAGEQAGRGLNDEFEFMASDPIFSDTDIFLQWELEPTFDDSPIRKCLSLYQDLNRFHQHDNQRSAIADLELARFRFGNNHAIGENKTKRYQSALERFSEKHRDITIYARAQAALSSVYSWQGDLAGALAQAQLGFEAFPESVGGAMCFNAIENIEEKHLSIHTERVWNRPTPKISINYKNLTRVYCQLIPVDFVEELEGRNASRRLNKERLAKRKSIKTWTVNLPATDDFRRRTHEIEAPLDVPKGYYHLQVSTDPDFGRVSMARIWVSNLAIVLRKSTASNAKRENDLGGFIVDALSGTPIADASIQYWVATYPEGKMFWERRDIVHSDRNGIFTLPDTKQKAVVILASSDGDSLATDLESFWTENHRITDTGQTVFFTDRSVYRPGQSIFFKGICLSMEQSVDRYTTVAGEMVNVCFRDAQHQEIETLSLKTNDFGSFSGTFTAPRDGVTGQMSISVIDGPAGSTSFHVEEYKRPRFFEVNIAFPEQEFHLDEEIEVSGNATDFAGAAVDGAHVSWRIVRQEFYPDWWYVRRWRFMPGYYNSKEIARGTTTTNGLGRFDLKFIPSPNPDVPTSNELMFHYTVYVEVTDDSGETYRNRESVNVGFTTIKASVGVAHAEINTDPDERNGKFEPIVHSTSENTIWLVAGQPVELRVLTQTLNESPSAAKGE